MRFPILACLLLSLLSQSGFAEDAAPVADECDAGSNGIMNKITEKLDGFATECKSFVAERNGIEKASACTHTDCDKIDEEQKKHKDRIKDRNQFCNIITFNSKIDCSKSTEESVADCKKGVQEAIANVKELLRKVMEEQDKSNGEMKAFLGKLKSEKACLNRVAGDEDKRCGPTQPPCGEEGRASSEAGPARAALGTVNGLITYFQPVHGQGVTLFVRDARGLGITIATSDNLTRDTQRLQSASPDTGPLKGNTPNTASTITGTPNAPPPGATPASATPAPAPTAANTTPSAPDPNSTSITHAGRKPASTAAPIPAQSATGDPKQNSPSSAFLPGENGPSQGYNPNLHSAEGKGNSPNRPGVPAIPPKPKKDQTDEAVGGFKNGIPYNGKVVLAGAEEKKVKGLMKDLLGNAMGSSEKSKEGKAAGGEENPPASKAETAASLAGGTKSDPKGEKKAEGDDSLHNSKKDGKKDDPDSIVAAAKEALAAIKAKYGVASAPGEEGGAEEAAAGALTEEHRGTEMDSATQERILREMTLFERVKLAHLRCHSVGCVYYGGI